MLAFWQKDMRGGSSQEDGLDVRISKERQDMELEAQLELENPDLEEDIEILATLLAGDLHSPAPAGTADARDSANDRLKKRRLTKGAAQSALVFQRMFKSYDDLNCNRLTSDLRDVT